MSVNLSSVHKLILIFDEVNKNSENLESRLIDLWRVHASEILKQIFLFCDSYNPMTSRLLYICIALYIRVAMFTSLHNGLLIITRSVVSLAAVYARFEPAA